MATIYLSSTYSDLAECREAVCKALRRMRLDVIAMEDCLPHTILVRVLR